jgi:hypothetical protein
MKLIYLFFQSLTILAQDELSEEASDIMRAVSVPRMDEVATLGGQNNKQNIGYIGSSYNNINAMKTDEDSRVSKIGVDDEKGSLAQTLFAIANQ